MIKVISLKVLYAFQYWLIKCIISVSVDHRIVLTIEHSRFELVNNAHEIISSALDAMIDREGNRRWQRREKRNINLGNIKVFSFRISWYIDIFKHHSTIQVSHFLHVYILIVEFWSMLWRRWRKRLFLYGNIFIAQY